MMNEFDYEDLLCSLFSISDEQRERSDFNIENVCFDEFNISFCHFVYIASQLLPLTPIVKSPLSKTRHHAFIHNGTAFVKMKAEED
ncbi:hypothetical protein SGGMMB4_04689 [Sodalis glossinidius str. 'morsitans']|uniref:Uncharacterized protein n=1 Tax=Sodalis glossinidius (strain morsitans) TaxID=343509 RepID=A0A193QMU4_SODGM|nr:hypothetical protein [Sodalis glossinidius]CRL46240.1 hypothetical protein SGGMMB4_04689 [Sodalis glossinidius str. 'morsitans']